ncbi:DinB family protein [Paenibacillus piri]|uniref:DinB family protein n=1 Tax=Paenibacillus piri TaxID=2547395 RepID=A0A4R5KPI4_9BACL|nr:DinB family protein [Paenibacillus piri]TDF97486.1 DinB family protein [Paenibacillus piri]
MEALNESRDKLWACIAGLTEEQLHRSNGDAWSALENLEHLHLMEHAVSGLLQQALQAPPGGAVPRVNLESMLDRSNKYNAPPFGQPRGLVQNLDQAKQLLGESQSALEAVHAAVRQLDHPETYSMEHPVYGAMNLDQWLELFALHTLRHLAQIEQSLSRSNG